MERLTWTEGECYRLWKRSPERNKKKLDYATHMLGRPPHIEKRDNGQRDGEKERKTEGWMQNKHAKANKATKEKDKKAIM